MERYEAYKDSGVEWIGEVPETWSVSKIKFTSTLAGRIGWQGLTSDEYREDGPYLITGVNFRDGSINWDTCVRITEERWEEATQIQIANGDLLITKDGTVGKVAIVDGLDDKASLNSGVLLIRHDDSYRTRYMYYLLGSSVFWDWFRYINAGNSTIIHLYQASFQNFAFPVPTSEEQETITSYLDEKTAEIDSIVSETERSIELLREYRKSVISEAVTKGIDSNVPMKDSGIEWIGEMPARWRVAKINVIGSTSSGATPSVGREGDSDGADIKWVRTLDLNDSEVSETSEYISRRALDNSSCSIMPIDTVCVAMYGGKGTIGKYGILKAEAATNQAVCSIVCKESLEYPKYLFYQLSAMRPYWMKSAVGTRKDPNISQDIVAKAIVLVPQLDEQISIANYLDTKTSEIDALIADKERQVELLKEYRKSLISEAVTGKFKIPGVS